MPPVVYYVKKNIDTPTTIDAVGKLATPFSQTTGRSIQNRYAHGESAANGVEFQPRSSGTIQSACTSFKSQGQVATSSVDFQPRSAKVLSTTQKSPGQAAPNGMDFQIRSSGAPRLISTSTKTKAPNVVMVETTPDIVDSQYEAAKQVQQSDMQTKLQALEQEASEAKAKLQAVQEESTKMKVALAEAKTAQAEDAMMAAVASRMLSTPSVSPILRAPSSVIEAGKRIIGKMTSEELDHHYDVVIIGGGPVGVAAALKAAVLGHRSIIVDKPKIAPAPSGLDPSFGGPTGLWSKALRDTGKHVDVPALQSMHLDDDVIWHQVNNMCLKLATSNASHQVKTLEKFKVSYLQASATVVSSQNVLVNQGTGTEPFILQTDYVLVATGSKPLRPPEIPFDDYRIFDSDTINSLSFLPKSVAVLGSGIIAIEYAKIFRKLGVKVTMLVRSECQNALERIGLDHDIASLLIEVLHEDDVAIYENTTVTDWDVPLNREDGMITLKLKSRNADVPSQIKVDVFLAATGRKPNVFGWGAEKLGIKLAAKGGHVEVNEKYETSAPGVYAVGDVIGPPSLASTGAYQAQAAMLEMFGQGHMNKFGSFPVGMWTTPECGYYGLTMAAATKKGIQVREGCVRYDACLRGRVFAPVGLLKLVFREDDGVIVGVHIIGDDACELVHYGMDLVKQEVSIFKVMTTCFTAVTFHELFKEAALDGNSKLEFGLEWHKILDDIGAHIDNHEHGMDIEKMQALFQEADLDGDGCLDWKELMAAFHKYGCEISRATASNLVRLSVKEEGETAVHWDEFAKIFDVLEDVRGNSHFAAESSPMKKSSSQTAMQFQNAEKEGQLPRSQDFAPPIAGA
jgi:NAD(P) transhydrogenase